MGGKCYIRTEYYYYFASKGGSLQVFLNEWVCPGAEWLFLLTIYTENSSFLFCQCKCLVLALEKKHLKLLFNINKSLKEKKVTLMELLIQQTLKVITRMCVCN